MTDPGVRILVADDHPLYRRGLAPVVLLSDAVPSVIDEREDRTYTRLLQKRGVPGSSIRVLPGASTSTRDEVHRVRDYVLAHPGTKRIIVVTSAFHTARARWIFRKVLRGTGVEVRMAAATVPLYKTLIPAFSPPLMPLTTKSGRLGQYSEMPILTESAGLPSTAQRRCWQLRQNWLRAMDCPARSRWRSSWRVRWVAVPDARFPSRHRTVSP